MGVATLPAGSVLLTGSTVHLVLGALKIAQRSRIRNGLPPLRAYVDLMRAMADNGHADSDDTADGHHEDMTIEEAANTLGVSVRTTRRLAGGLGGRKVGRAWLLDRAAVLEHAEGCGS